MRRVPGLIVLSAILGLVPSAMWAESSNAEIQNLEAAIFAVPVPADGSVPAPVFDAKRIALKSSCTATQDMCPGGGTVTCTGTTTCTVFCGQVKCDNQAGVVHCPNPCCSVTYTCWDGSFFTCINFKHNDCSTTADAVYCDGACPPHNCSTDPCLCPTRPPYCFGS
jgi:hypothetical protein